MSNVPTQTLQYFIIESLLRNLQSTFNAPSYLLTTSDRWKLASVLNKLKLESKVDLPIVFLKISSLSKSNTSYNVGSLVRRGIYGALSSDNSTVVNIPIMPVDMTFEVVYLTTDFYQVLDYATQWMFASANGALNSTITYSDVDIDIKVAPDANLTVPEKDNTSDVANVYEITSSLIVNGYFTSMAADTRTVDVVTKIEPVLREYTTKEEFI